MVYSDFRVYLLDYFKQLHLNKMDSGRKAALEKMRGPAVGNPPVYPEDKRNKAQQSWDIDALPPEMTAIDPDTGGMILADDEIAEFYFSVRTVFRNMQINKNDIDREYPGLSAKWAPFFGPGKSFDEFVPDPSIDRGSGNNRTGFLPELVNFIMNDEGIIASSVRDTFTRGYSQSRFIADFNKKNYCSEFISQVDQMVRHTQYMVLNDPNLQNDTNATPFLPGGKFTLISDGINQEQQPVNTASFLSFLQDDTMDYKKFLGLIRESEDFRKAFSANGGEHIITTYDYALKQADYSAIKPLATNRKNVIKDISDDINDSIADWGKKFTTKHGRHKYTSPVAKGIMDVIVDEKFNPTEGLGKVLANSDKIKEKLEGEYPAATGVWKTFNTIMKDMQNSMKDTFNGALKFGYLMNHMLYHKDEDGRPQGVIARAVEMGKVQDCYAILEILHVMQYDIGTSEKWEEWSKVKFEPFKGVKGFDKGFLKGFATGTSWVLNTGIDAIFWGAQFTINAINHRGVKFGKNSDDVPVENRQIPNQNNANPIQQPENNDDPYIILGVSRNASSEEIRSAHRRMAMRYHPDLNNNPDAAGQFRRINEAYERIRTEERRQEYNAEHPINDANMPAIIRNPANQAQQEEQQQNNNQYSDVGKLMAFWDFLNSGRANDLHVLHKHSTMQEEFNRTNATNESRNAVFKEWASRNGRAA